MTRKKSRPQHRETVCTEFEGYKMFWTSMENDEERADSETFSPSVIHNGDSDNDGPSNADENSDVNPVTLSSQDTNLPVFSSDFKRSSDVVSHNSEIDNAPLQPTCPQDNIISFNQTINSGSMDQSGLEVILPPSSNFLGSPQAASSDRLNHEISSISDEQNSQAPDHPISLDVETLSKKSGSTDSFEVSGDQVSHSAVIVDRHVEIPLEIHCMQLVKGGENTTEPSREVKVEAVNIDDVSTISDSTGKALSLLKTLLLTSGNSNGSNPTIEVNPNDDLNLGGNSNMDTSPTDLNSLNVDPIETDLSTNANNLVNHESLPNSHRDDFLINSMDCIKPSQEDLPSQIGFSLNTDTPIIDSSAIYNSARDKHKITSSGDKFPMSGAFLPVKVKMESNRLSDSLELMRRKLKQFCEVVISLDAFNKSKADLEPKEKLDSLNTVPCFVTLERLPSPITTTGRVVISDHTFRIWKKKITRRINNEKFKHLKVWRRGTTILFRECQMDGMDRATYDEQVAFIREHKLSDSSSSDEETSEVEGGEMHTDGSATDSSGIDESNGEVPSVKKSLASTTKVTRSKHSFSTKENSTNVDSNQVLERKLRNKVKSNSTNSTLPCKDEYIVERNTVDEKALNSKDKSTAALKITIRKTSVSKSEDEKDKSHDSEAENLGMSTKSGSTKVRKFVTKRTYRKLEETPVVSPMSTDSQNSEISKRRKSHTMDEEDQSLLGRRSYEVENFNLLEKWEIPFEAPTLFRSPRVASRLAQLKNKEAFKNTYFRKPPVHKVSKEVKDVVDMLCTKTVDAILSPDVLRNSDNFTPRVTKPLSPINNPNSKQVEVPNTEKTLTVDEGNLNEVSVLNCANEDSLLSESTCDKLENTLSDKMSDDDNFPLKDSSKQSIKFVNESSTKVRRIRKKPFGYRKKKNKAKYKDDAENDLKGDSISQIRTSPLPSTQVPVVTEGPGENSNESENDEPQASDSVVSNKTRSCLDSVSNTTVRLEDVPEYDKVDDDPILPRVTRAKQPHITLDPDILENFGVRRKKKQQNMTESTENNCTSETTDENASTKKPQRATRKRKRKQIQLNKHGELSTKTPPRTNLEDESCNTQVDEVSEGPGERSGGRGEFINKTDKLLNVSDHTIDVATQNSNSQSVIDTGSVDVCKEPQSIPESPMSPSPDTNEPLPNIRITRSKRRSMGEGTAYIGLKKSPFNNNSGVESFSESEPFAKEVTSAQPTQPQDSLASCTDTFSVAISSTEKIGDKEGSSDQHLTDCQGPGSFKSPNDLLNADLPQELTGQPDIKTNIPVSCEVDINTTGHKETVYVKDRLAVLDKLNVILTSNSPIKKNHDDKCAASTPCQSFEKSSIETTSKPLTVDEDESDLDTCGDLVVDEGLSDENTSDNVLDNCINNIVHNQILPDDKVGVDMNEKKLISEEPATRGENLIETQKPHEPKINNILENKSESVDINKTDWKMSSDVKDISESSKDVPEKKRDSIDERTGLPTTLIQRLRDPRIRSKLLSRLQSEDVCSPGESNTLCQNNSLSKDHFDLPGVTTSEPQFSASRDPRMLKSSLTDAPQNVSFLPTAVSAGTSIVSNASNVSPCEPNPFPVKGKAPSDGSVKPNLLVPPKPPLTGTNDPKYDDQNKSDKLSDDDDDEEESIKRRPKKNRKEVDVELMYKSPLEDLQSEIRPSYGRNQARRYTISDHNRRDVGDNKHSRWGNNPMPRRVPVSNTPYNFDKQRSFQQEQWPTPHIQFNREDTTQSFNKSWCEDNFHQNDDFYMDPNVQCLKNQIFGIAMLPKTTSLNIPPFKKIYSYFDNGNPQVLPIAPATYDLEEKTRTITMLDPMGQEMIDIIQLPRPTSGLTKEYLNILPADFSMDSIISNPSVPLFHIVDEEVENDSCGLDLFDDLDEEIDILKSKVIPEKIDNHCLKQPEGKINDNDVKKCKITAEVNKEPPSISKGSTISEQVGKNLLCGSDPLSNIFKQLPILKETLTAKPPLSIPKVSQEIPNKSNDVSKKIDVAKDKPVAPPPPKWTTDVDLRVGDLFPLSKDGVEHWGSPMSPTRPKKKKKKSKSRKSKSPKRKRSRSKSSRRKQYGESKSRDHYRRSRSRSPEHQKGSKSRSSYDTISLISSSLSPLSSPARLAEPPSSRCQPTSWSRSRSRSWSRSRSRSWSRSRSRSSSWSKSPTRRSPKRFKTFQRPFHRHSSSISPLRKRFYKK